MLNGFWQGYDTFKYLLCVYGFMINDKMTAGNRPAPVGLTARDWKLFHDLLVKANDLQLGVMEDAVFSRRTARLFPDRSCECCVGYGQFVSGLVCPHCNGTGSSYYD